MRETERQGERLFKKPVLIDDVDAVDVDQHPDYRQHEAQGLK